MKIIIIIIINEIYSLLQKLNNNVSDTWKVFDGWYLSWLFYQLGSALYLLVVHHVFNDQVQTSKDWVRSCPKYQVILFVKNGISHWEKLQNALVTISSLSETFWIEIFDNEPRHTTKWKLCINWFEDSLVIKLQPVLSLLG